MSGPGRGLSRGVVDRVLAGVAAVFWGVLFFGLIDLTVFTQGAEFHQSFQVETGWGLFFTFVVAAPLLAVAVGPRTVRPAALHQVGLAAIAVAVGAALSRSPMHLYVVAGLVATVGLLVVAGGGALGSTWLLRGWSLLTGLVALSGAVPWFSYALTSAQESRDGVYSDETAGLQHLPIQAALAIAMVVISVLVATYPSGWRIPAVCVGVCAAWLGTTSVVYPDLEASLGRFWGVAAIVWGGSARRSVATGPTSPGQDARLTQSGAVGASGHHAKVTPVERCRPLPSPPGHKAKVTPANVVGCFSPRQVTTGT